MRRLWAVVLLAVFSAPLIPTLVSAGQREAKLPPCCRRDGKHGCAMMAAMAGVGEDGVPAFRGGKAKCPLYPSGKAAPAAAAAHVPRDVRWSLHTPVMGRVAAQTEFLCQRSYQQRPASPRGPPSPLS